MGKIIFILGGARSGKSQFAAKVAEEKAKKVAFVATCLPKDLEMKRRVKLHQKNRPKTWQTFEELYSISPLLKKIDTKFDLILIDCLTLLVSNLLLKKFKPKAIEAEVDKILSMLKKIKTKSIIVSNEVGLGIVPKNKLARDFRDIAGRINQRVANKANRVFFIVCGIPWRIK